MKKLPSNLHVGASSWSSTDWYEVFYPTDLKPAEFITHYAKHFDTVEIDSTWHHMPSASVVDGWREKTPDGFIFQPRSLKPSPTKNTSKIAGRR